MKAFQVNIFKESDGSVDVKKGIDLEVYEWRSYDPFIGIGNNIKIFPPPLLSKIIGDGKRKKLMEIDGASALLLTDKSDKPIFNNGFSLADLCDSMLVLVCVGHLEEQGFYTSDYLGGLKNCYLAAKSYYEESASRWRRRDMLTILPADGGGVGGKIRYGNDFLLKTVNGKIEMEQGKNLLK